MYKRQLVPWGLARTQVISAFGILGIREYSVISAASALGTHEDPGISASCATGTVDWTSTVSAVQEHTLFKVKHICSLVSIQYHPVALFQRQIGDALGERSSCAGGNCTPGPERHIGDK